MADQYKRSGVPVLRGVNVNFGRFHDDDFVFIDEETADRLRKFESFPGDVLLVHKGTLGRIGLMPDERRYGRYIMGNSMMRVRCDPTKLLPEYLYYWLSSADGQHYLFSRVSQVGVPQLQTPLTTLRQARLPVPPLAEQSAIVRVLGALDDKIELNHRMSQTLESMAHVVFGQEFGGTLSVTPLGSMVESLREQVRPFAFPNRPFDHHSIPAFDQSGLPARERGDKIKSAKWRVAGDTVLLSKLNPEIERVWLPVVSADHIAVCSTEFLVLRPVPPATRAFIYCLLRSAGFREQLQSVVSGTTGSRQRANSDAILALPVVVPGEKALRGFDRGVAPLLHRAAQIRQETTFLSWTRDLLLPRLMSASSQPDELENGWTQTSSTVRRSSRLALQRPLMDGPR